VAPEIVLERPTGEADGNLRIRARAYSLSLGQSSHFILLDDAEGRRWADLALLASVDSQSGVDTTTDIGEAQLSPLTEGWRVAIPLGSSAWSAKTVTIDCFDDWFQIFVEVEGRGDITDVHLLGGEYTGDLRRGTGFYRSAARFASLFNPEPSRLERRCTPPEVSSVIDVMGTDLPGLQHWFFTPAPFCYAASLSRPPADPSALPEGPWLTFGLAVEPGEHDFTGFAFDALEDGFSIRLTYEGHHSVDGRWRSPALLFGFGAPDPYAGIRQYVAWLEALALVPPAVQRIRPGWWRRPIFCGWGAQSHRGLLAGTPAQSFATQLDYDEFLGQLLARGLKPGTIVIDDKWQSAYGTGAADADKWPDLTGWIAQRHEAGQRVLLWWKAWDPQGLEPDLCVRDARGRPVAADPSNPAYEAYLRAVITDLLSEDRVDADGFKIDFTARTPSGASLRSHGGGWGAELLHRLLAIIYSQAKRIKPDALIITHTPNAYFRNVTDMIRLNDVNSAHPVLPQMWHRARVAQAACPDLLIDPDNWQMPDRASWRSYLAVQPQIGVPSLYYATHVDLSSESFEEGDYAAIADAWETAESP
jgi:hypothetical protein